MSRQARLCLAKRTLMARLPLRQSAPLSSITRLPGASGVCVCVCVRVCVRPRGCVGVCVRIRDCKAAVRTFLPIKMWVAEVARLGILAFREGCIASCG